MHHAARLGDIVRMPVPRRQLLYELAQRVYLVDDVAAQHGTEGGLVDVLGGRPATLAVERVGVAVCHILPIRVGGGFRVALRLLADDIVAQGLASQELLHDLGTCHFPLPVIRLALAGRPCLPPSGGLGVLALPGGRAVGRAFTAPEAGRGPLVDGADEEGGVLVVIVGVVHGDPHLGIAFGHAVVVQQVAEAHEVVMPLPLHEWHPSLHQLPCVAADLVGGQGCRPAGVPRGLGRDAGGSPHRLGTFAMPVGYESRCREVEISLRVVA